MATKLNIFVDQGADFSIEIPVLDDNDAPVDLTTYTAESTGKRHFKSANSFSLSTDMNANGILTLSLSANTSSSLEYGRYVYDVEITSNTAVVTRVIEGILTINPEVTT